MSKVYRIEIELTTTQYRYIEAHMVKPGTKGRESVTTVCGSLLHELLADDMAEFTEEMEEAVRSAEAAI